MPKESIAVLLNPVQNQKRKKILQQVLLKLNQNNIKPEVFRETWPTEINNFKQAWIIGGDGTLNYFMNYYRDINIPIAIFKGGTGNDFAWKLYGEMNSENQIEHILKCETKPVDAGICNDKVFINGIGIGFDGEVLKSITTIRRMGGHLGYLWIVLKKIFSFNEFTFNIDNNEATQTEKYLLVLITNSSRTGGGFLVSPQADIHDGKLNMILCNPLSIISRLKYLPLIEKGKHLKKPFIQHSKIAEVKISCKQEVYAQLDGELIRDTTFDIRILPDKYLFLY
ncbi:diacylglycerol kinase family lipid kinase [soil metagenome]